MGLFGFLREKKPVHNDPELGELVYSSSSGFWEGEAAFADAREPLVVALPGDESGPSVEGRAVYTELKERYASLRNDIAGALFELYDNYRSDAKEDDYTNGLPRLREPAEIWGTTSLDDVTIWSTEPGSTQIELTYTFDWHEDHMFGVRLENWSVTGVSIDG